MATSDEKLLLQEPQQEHLQAPEKVAPPNDRLAGQLPHRMQPLQEPQGQGEAYPRSQYSTPEVSSSLAMSLRCCMDWLRFTLSRITVMAWAASCCALQTPEIPSRLKAITLHGESGL